MSFSVVVVASLAFAGQSPPAPSSSAAPPPAAVSSGHVDPSRQADEGPSREALTADRAWIRLPPPGAKMLAGYVVLRNPGAEALKVTGVSTSLSPRAELHTHVMEAGLMKMRQVPFIEVPAHSEVRMQPGGLHIMVMKLASPPKEGDVVDVTLTLEDGRKVALKATVYKEEPVTPPPYPTVG